MYIELHDTLLDHRKLKRLSKDIGVPSVHVRGHLVTLWMNVLRHAPDGNLVDWSHEDVADYAEWSGAPEVFVDALVKHGWLVKRDDHVEVNDWREYAGHLKVAERKAADRERKRREREQSRVRQDEDGTSGSERERPDVSVSVRGRPRTTLEFRSDPIRSDPNRTDQSNAQSSSSSAPESDAPPAVVTIPLVDGSEHPFTAGDVSTWREAYPAVDVLQQLRAMREWSLANPRKRKTKRGVRAFVVNWLQREQDKGGTRGRAGPPLATKTPSPFLTDAEREDAYRGTRGSQNA